jgi:hypothetical protein
MELGVQRRRSIIPIERDREVAVRESAQALLEIRREAEAPSNDVARVLQRISVEERAT